MVKKILDATAGGRMMWWDKQHPSALYVDQRTLAKGEHPNSSGFHVTPDIIASFTDLPFKDNHFKLVVFDPPHIIRLTDKPATSNMGLCYGVLLKDTWRQVIRDGFRECWRVLDNDGVLIFKWAEDRVTTKEVLALLPADMEPLFGHRTRGSTHWITFMKIVH